jgi:signal transduction protein with GAF and PtsI domain
MDDGSQPAVDPVLAELLTRAEVVSRLRSGSEARLLQSILDAAVALFRAQAASIALATADGETLEFIVAAGSQGTDVVGLRIGAGQGIAGYVYQTGEAIALADPRADPRFGRAVAEQTGYVPDSLLAVPLQTPERTIGVLEILDCRDGSFGSEAIALASVFARQAGVAIEASRVEREFPVLVAHALESYGLELSPEHEAAVRALPARVGDDFWELVDEIATLQQASPEMRAFIRDLLPVASRHLGKSRERRFAR